MVDGSGPLFSMYLEMAVKKDRSPNDGKQMLKE
jgi:hypothetical protein